jgi:hypothetical protein
LPDQVSLAVISAECVTTVPLVCPHGGTAAVTVTVAAPLLVASSELVAVIVYEPAATVVKTAVRPLAVSVPPVGAALHVTPPLHVDVALSVAVSAVLAPVFIAVGLAATPTPLTAHAGGFGVLAALPDPHDCTNMAIVPKPNP